MDATLLCAAQASRPLKTTVFATNRPVHWEIVNGLRRNVQAGRTAQNAHTIVSMSRVIFMCGPAGSGKSTVARRLEGKGMVRLSFDVAAWQAGLRAAAPSNSHSRNRHNRPSGVGRRPPYPDWRHHLTRLRWISNGSSEPCRRRVVPAALAGCPVCVFIRPENARLSAQRP